MPSPTVIDVHDSTLPTAADALSSGTAGTLVGVRKWGPGGVVGVAAPMSPTAAPFPIVGNSGYSLTRLSLFGSVAALPEVDNSGPYARIATVRYGPFAPGAPLSVLAIPASKAYLTSLGASGLLVYDFAAKELELLGAGGTRTVSRIPADADIQPADYSAFTASSDGIAAAVSLAGFRYYARLAAPGEPVTEAVTLPDANDVLLTPTYVVGWSADVGGATVGYLRRTAIPDSGSAPGWTVLYTDGSPGYSIDKLTATDGGVAWTSPTGQDGDCLYTMAMPVDTAPTGPVAYQRTLPNPALSSFEGTGDFLLCDVAAQPPGLYRLSPGSQTGTFVGTLGTHWSMTYGLAVSEDRAAYSDDTTATYPVFVRDVGNPGQPGPETQVTPVSDAQMAICGPFVAVGRPASGTSADVSYGRIGSPLSVVTLPAADVVRIRLSGHRLLVTGGTDSWLIDVLAGGSPTKLGHVFAAVWGDQLVTLNYETALLQRRNLLSGASVTLLPAAAGCGTSECVDAELWNLAAWGTKTVYSFSYGGTAPGWAVGMHDSVTGATSALPLAPDSRVYALAYSDDLLLTYGPATEVRLYDMHTTPAGQGLLGGYAESPIALDGYIAAWRPDSDLRAVVQDVRDIFPAYHLSSARYLNGSAPYFFTSAIPAWQPRFYVTRDVDWVLDIRFRSRLLRRLTGRSSHGEISPSWDGRDRAGKPVKRNRTYTWTLSGTALDGMPLRNGDGTSTVAASGTVRG